MSQYPLLISRSQVRTLLDWESVLAATREGLLMLPGGQDCSSVATQVIYSGGSLHLKAAASEVRQLLSVKSNLRPTNGGVSGVLLVYDLQQDCLAGIVDAGFMTAFRTAAIAVLATQELLSQGPVRLAVLGTGPVGRQLMLGLQRSLDVKEFRVWSRHAPRAKEALELLGQNVLASSWDTVAEAVDGVDIVVTATPAIAPVLHLNDLTSQPLILAMGADTVGKQELDLALLEASDIVADVIDDAKNVGDCSHLPTEQRDRVQGLGVVMHHETSLQRDHHHLVFDSVGSSLVDAAVASVILARARERGLGVPINLSI